MLIPDIFLDTSALFSGIWSETGGARMLLKLGEATAIKLSVSSIDKIIGEFQDHLGLSNAGIIKKAR
jgi:hypothetical protein